MAEIVRIIGVSLGHRHEKTAISVVERVYVLTGEAFNATRYDDRGRFGLEAREGVRTEYRVRHLERMGAPSRYPEIAERVGEVSRRIGGNSSLVVDVTATGRPVYSLIMGEVASALEGTRSRFKHCPVTVTGVAGGVSKSPDAGWLVPRRDLISAALILFDEGRLKIASRLELARTLTDELVAFKPKPGKADDLEGWRERPHDDLVLSVALSAWAAERVLRKESSVPAGALSAGVA